MACHTLVCLPFSPLPNPPPASLLSPSFPPCFIILSFYCPVLVTAETEGHSCVSLSSFIFLSSLIVQAAWSINLDSRFHNPIRCPRIPFHWIQNTFPGYVHFPQGELETQKIWFTRKPQLWTPHIAASLGTSVPCVCKAIPGLPRNAIAN